MTRKEFIRMCGILGIGLPLIKACSSSIKTTSLKQSEKVLIIGAGAVGLTAAHLLNQHGIRVEILEASSIHGGRMKRTNRFANFPIPTGAEWLHSDKSILSEIVNNRDVEISIETKPYNFDVDYALVNGKKENLKQLGFSIDQKFINATWFDFFEQYIVPGIKHNIRYNHVVQSIEYANDQLIVTTNEENFSADRVILTVPVKILQSNSIQFIPELPEQKVEALKRVTIWGGCKAFLEFSDKFYPTITASEMEASVEGHKLFYDAAYGQTTEQNILGLFVVGPIAEPYLRLPEQERIEYILNELDEIFDGQASENFKKHIFQNWTEEPFIEGAYVWYFEDWRTIRALRAHVADKLYFAGDAYTDGSEWSSVHAAARSAQQLVGALIA